MLEAQLRQLQQQVDEALALIDQYYALYSDTAAQTLATLQAIEADLNQIAQSAEAMAHGQILTDELVAAIAEEYARTLDPLTDVRGSAWYRKEMIRVFVKRALQEVRIGNW